MSINHAWSTRTSCLRNMVCDCCSMTNPMQTTAFSFVVTPPSSQQQSPQCRPRLLPVASQRQAVVALPHTTARRTCLGSQMPLGTQPTVALACTGQATELAVLVHRVGDPVDTRIGANCLVVWVYQNYLKVLVCGVLCGYEGWRCCDTHVVIDMVRHMCCDTHATLCMHNLHPSLSSPPFPTYLINPV